MRGLVTVIKVVVEALNVIKKVGGVLKIKREKANERVGLQKASEEVRRCLEA